MFNVDTASFFLGCLVTTTSVLATIILIGIYYGNQTISFFKKYRSFQATHQSNKTSIQVEVEK